MLHLHAENHISEHRQSSGSARRSQWEGQEDPSLRSPWTTTSRTRHGGGQHLVGDREPAAPRAPATSPQPAHLPVLIPRSSPGMLQARSSSPSFGSKPSPREEACGWSQMRLSP